MRFDGEQIQSSALPPSVTLLYDLIFSQNKTPPNIIKQSSLIKNRKRILTP